MGYLDKDGLSHLWGKITEYVAQNGGVGGVVDWENINGRPDLSGVSSMKVTQIVLLAAVWESDNTQTVDVTGILADENQQLIIPVPKLEGKSAYISAGIECISQAADSLTFQCASVPAEDIRVNVFVFGAAEVGEEYTFEWWSPQMTSNDSPAPYKALANYEYISSTYGQYYAYYAFDGKITTDAYYGWYTGSQPAWIQFDFGTATDILGIRFMPKNDQHWAGFFPKKIEVVGSDDGENWTEIASDDGASYTPYNYEWRTIMFPAAEKFRYYRAVCTGAYGQYQQVCIDEIEFLKRRGG